MTLISDVHRDRILQKRFIEAAAMACLCVLHLLLMFDHSKLEEEFATRAREWAAERVALEKSLADQIALARKFADDLQKLQAEHRSGLPQEL